MLTSVLSATLVLAPFFFVVRRRKDEKILSTEVMDKIVQFVFV